MSSMYTNYPRTTLWLLQEDNFTMGGQPEDSSPRFHADVAPIYIGKTIFTNEQYEAHQPNHERGVKIPGDDNAAVNISFNEPVGYCEWYSKRRNKYFRLPTAIEWKYACRENAQSVYHWVDSITEAPQYMYDAAFTGAESPPLNTLKPNEFGRYDMLGMMWEWTSSMYLSYPVLSDDGRDDLSKSGDRVARVGAFRETRKDIGNGTRKSFDPDLNRDDVEFRIVRSLR